jgi:putative ABC transport system substrate-binding protein
MTVGIGRRQFVAAFGGASLGWPLAARAQQPAMPVVGFLGLSSADTAANIVVAWRKGLGEQGFVEDQNVAIEFRWAESHFERLPALAEELVSHQVAVISVFGSSAAAREAKAATKTIPIVFLAGTDPVKYGLVSSLNHPGSNLTGVSILGPEMASKRLEVLHELVPQAEVIAALVNPDNLSAETQSSELQAAARTIGRHILILNARTESDIDTVFATLVQQRANGLLVGGDGLFLAQRDKLVALAMRHAIPAVYEWRECVEAGGLISYGANLAESYRQVGVYVGRILKGEKPADLPVQQPTKFELLINLKTAKALGLKVPQSILARADDVIE